MGIQRAGIPIQMAIEELRMQDCIPIYVFSDSDSGIAAIKAGVSARMRHLSKTHGISIAWINGIVYNGINELQFIDGVRQLADILTKFDRNNFHEIRAHLGVRQMDPADYHD